MNIDDIKQMEGIVEREAALSSMVAVVESVSATMRTADIPLDRMMSVYRATSAVRLLFRSQTEEAYTFAKERVAVALADCPVGNLHACLAKMDALCDIIRGWA
jgi:hypothetical protein